MVGIPREAKTICLIVITLFPRIGRTPSPKTKQNLQELLSLLGDSTIRAVQSNLISLETNNGNNWLPNCASIQLGGAPAWVQLGGDDYALPNPACTFWLLHEQFDSAVCASSGHLSLVVCQPHTDIHRYEGICTHWACTYPYHKGFSPCWSENHQQVSFSCESSPCWHETWQCVDFGDQWSPCQTYLPSFDWQQPSNQCNQLSHSHWPGSIMQIESQIAKPLGIPESWMFTFLSNTSAQFASCWAWKDLSCGEVIISYRNAAWAPAGGVNNLKLAVVSMHVQHKCVFRKYWRIIKHQQNKYDIFHCICETCYYY